MIKANEERICTLIISPSNAALYTLKAWLKGKL